MKSCKIRSNGLCRHASIQTILITFALLLSQKGWEQENNWEDFWSCNLLIIILSLLLGPLSEILRLCYLLKVHNIKKHVSEIVGFWLGSQIGCSYMVYWQFFVFFLWLRLYKQYGTSEFMSICSVVQLWLLLLTDEHHIKPVSVWELLSQKPERKGHEVAERDKWMRIDASQTADCLLQNKKKLKM